MSDAAAYTGGCLCGQIRFSVQGELRDPHTCSCQQCQRHSGSLTLAWVELDKAQLRWIGPSGAPQLWRSSATTSRAFCQHCGSTLGAIDDGATIALTLGGFDAPGRELAPQFHSFAEQRPCWWRVEDSLSHAPADAPN